MVRKTPIEWPPIFARLSVSKGLETGTEIPLPETSRTFVIRRAEGIRPSLVVEKNRLSLCARKSLCKLLYIHNELPIFTLSTEIILLLIFSPPCSWSTNFTNMKGLFTCLYFKNWICPIQNILILRNICYNIFLFKKR